MLCSLSLTPTPGQVTYAAVQRAAARSREATCNLVQKVGPSIKELQALNIRADAAAESGDVSAAEDCMAQIRPSA